MASRSSTRANSGPSFVLKVPAGTRVERVELAGWPFKGPRPNPSPRRIELEPPRWMPLRRLGEWSREARELVRGESGVYAIRETSNPRTVLYVGMSRGGDGLRFWKTILRHFFAWSLASEWNHRRAGDLDVALWLAPPAATYDAETAAILELEPLHAKARGGELEGAEADAPF